MAADVAVTGIRKTYGDVVAVDNVDLTVSAGEFFTLLGPSGSGKTTTLRIIAGFERPDHGSVTLGGEDITRRPPYARDVNTVFQDYALFPHMTVGENVGYGLKVKGVPRRERADRPAMPESDMQGEIWKQTRHGVTHFAAGLGTCGTITGTGRFLKEKNPAVVIVGCQPEEGSQIPGIRKWPVAYLPRIYDAKGVDRVESVSQADAEETARQLARKEGIFAGISSGGACAVALRIAREVENATIVFIVCDRGDRYLSTGVFPG